MKRFVLFAVLAVIVAWGWNVRTMAAATANTNALLVSFQITGLSQDTAVVTNNNVESTTYSANSLKIGNVNFLNLLQAEFGTTFPTGAQLAYYLTGDTGFHVLDQNGASILNVSTNPADSSYGFGLSNSIAGVYAQLLVGKAANNLVTSNQTETVTAYAPDYGIFFYDSHGNDFHIDGLLTLKINASMTASSGVYNSVSFTITGSGGGTIFNPTTGTNETMVFPKAKVSAKGSGIIE